jgi:uncharacterized protein YcsI (UPF0317 family)
MENSLREQSGVAVRHQCRAGVIIGATSGMAAGYVQANLVVLPQADAQDFVRFCVSNPKPCPILGLSEKGSPRIPSLGSDLDIRTDLPRYQVWKNGVLSEETSDITAFWREDLIAIAIGCSFSFEEALLVDGIPLRHITERRNVAMFKTSIPCQMAGRFGGNMVVSMRPLLAQDAIRAIQITSRMPAVHGAPIHMGNPALIGISNINTPDYGDAVSVLNDEIPVFWACGVTSQAAILEAKLDFAITHAPGAMLVTDRKNAEFTH